MTTGRLRAARVARFIYNALFPLAFLLMFPGLVRRMIRRGGFRRKIGQRFARYSPAVRERLGSSDWTWIHSISVGEMFIAIKLARAMKEADPSLRVVLSATTSTGLAEAEKAGADWLEVIYNPLDALPMVRRALDVVRPQRLVFIEAVWPNLLAEAHARGIPTALVPRLSPRSEARFRRFRAITAPIFRLLDLLCIQEKEDIARCERIGFPRERMEFTGSIKFDQPAHAATRAAEFRRLLEGIGADTGAPVLLGGSTHNGEEEMLAGIHAELRAKFPGLFLILVPRHAERAPAIAAKLRGTGVRVALRSEAATGPADCLLVDSTGELRDWYQLATVVFVGKSVTARGGQNPVEPALAGKPVVFGPHMENFAAIVRMLIASDAAIQAPDAGGLREEIARLLQEPARREQLARNARATLELHQGATGRTAQLLLKLPPAQS